MRFDAKVDRRLKALRHKKLLRDRASARYAKGEIPLAQQRIGGLWWIDGQDGWFLQVSRHDANATPVFDADTRFVVYLAPADPEEAAEAVIRHGEEEAMWQERLGEIPF